MFPCKFSKHEIVYWSLFNTFQWPIIAEKSYYKKQCSTCPLIPGNRQMAWWETAELQMALKDLNTIKLLLLDRKLHSKTTFFKRGKTGETGDSALHGVLGKKNPSNELLEFFKNFSQVLLYAFKFRMQLDLAMTHSNIFFNTGGRAPPASLLDMTRKGNWELQLSFGLAVSTHAVILLPVGKIIQFFNSFGQYLIIWFFFKSLKCPLIKLI